MLNQVTIMGTLTRDPEIKHAPSGTAITKIGIALNEKYKKQNGEEVEKAHFFDVTYMGRRAEIVNQYFAKGSRIIVTGSLQYESWTDQQGQKRSRVIIKGDSFEFVDRAPQTQPQNGYTQQQARQAYGQPQPQPAYQQPAPQQTPPVHRENIPHEIDISEDEIPF